jgi:uncharacterized damage-inducible protein DinB
MKLTDFFVAELEREAAGTRKALERVPEGRNDWQPHPKSMTLGRLSALVATMPTWIDMMVNQDQLDLRPVGGQPYQDKELKTSKELVEALDKALAGAKKALEGTTDEHLMTNWQLLVAGKVVAEGPRYVFIQDSVFNHLAHHRGQLTVFLRLTESSVPAIYGPSADEGKFE